MTSLARIPCTIVTGFLGSGKTTLIRHVLANANGRRLAVIVNDREPASVRIGEHVADQRRLARAEKAGDDGAGNGGERRHSVSFRKVDWRHAGDQPPLEHIRTATPGQEAVFRTGEKPRALDQRLGVPVGLKPPENIGPGAVASDGGAEGAAAIGQAFDLTDGDSGALGGFFRSQRQRQPGPRGVLGIAGLPAGDADIDGGRGQRGRFVLVCFDVGESHPFEAAPRAVRDWGAIGLGTDELALAIELPATEAPRPGKRPDRRQVSWLAGLSPSPPSRGSPVAMWFGLTAYSCGGSRGIGPKIRTAFPVRSHRERPSMGPPKGRDRPFSG